MSQVQEISTGSADLEPSVLESKLRPLPSLSRTVSRTGLVNRLRASPAPIALVLAPAGFGKTMLLWQWTERDERPAAWVSIDDEDDDPAVFVSYLSVALDRALGSTLSVPETAKPKNRSWSAILSGLARALSSQREPFVIVLDGVDTLTSRGSLRVVSVLADHLPEGSTLALTGRRPPRLPIARLRARGRLLELGPDELAMSAHEARLLLRGAGVRVEDERVAELMARTEGWPAGLYLAALAIEAAGARPEDEHEAWAGQGRFMADYVELEIVPALTAEQLSLLTRISVLEAFCPSLCAAVLERSDPVTELRELDRAGHFVALARTGDWYRLFQPFRHVLRAKLDWREPGIVPALNSRAADWYEEHSMPKEAVDHAHAAGETDRAARLVSSIWLPVLDRGCSRTVVRWLEGLDEEAVLERFPVLGVAGAWVWSLTGREAEAACWLESAARRTPQGRRAGADRSIQPLVALARAFMCRDGVCAMRADAELALRELPPRGPYRPTALLLQGIAHLLAGDDDKAEATLAEAAELSNLGGGSIAASVALAERGLLAIARGDHAEAEALVHRARDVVRDAGIEGYATTALVHAVAAHVAVRHGNLASVRNELARSEELVSSLGHALPWLVAQTRLELARANLAIADEEGAEVALAEVDALLRRRPRLGTLVESAHHLRCRMSSTHVPDGPHASSLTTAELRLVPLLATHLSFREIAERLFVSRNTVKTQAISVYRKLGVSSRSEAIARAADLGLIDRPAVPAVTRPAATPAHPDRGSRTA